MTEINIKLLIVGDSGVGKTSLLLQYTEERFADNHIATVGVEYRIKMFDYKNFKIKLQIWDTAGQERFHSITHNFFHNTDGILFVYDISNHNSFEGVKKWINEAKETASSFQPLLIGNKTDLMERDIKDEELKQYINENNLEYFEVSAKENKNIHETFNKIVELILKDKNDEEIQKEFGISNSTVTSIIKIQDKGKKKKNKNERCC